MRRVGEYSLWIGNARDARDIRAVLDAGIEAVVDLAVEEPPINPTRELIYLRFPFVDGEGNPPWLIHAAIAALEGLIRLRVPTLVACGAGMSRSPAIAAVARCFATDQRAPDMVLRKMQEDRPSDVHPAFWNEIMRVVCADDDAAMYRERDA